MDVTDNPVVRALLREVLQTGQKVIAFLKGTLLTICCAATRAVLFLYDLTSVPRAWLGHWWAFAFDWVVGHAGDGRAHGRRPNLLMMDRDDPAQEAENNNMRAVEEGLHRAAGAESLSQAAPASPSQRQHQQRQQCGSPFETSTRGVVSRATAAASGQEAHKMAVPRNTSAPNEMLPRSLVPHDPKPSVEGAVEGSACSDTGDNQERMLFELNQGEEEEASSFVPLSVAGSRVGRPMKWSLGYLGESAEEECGMIVGGGSFAKVSVVTLKSTGLKMAVKSIARYTAADDSLDEFIDMELKTLQAAGAHPNVVDCFGFIKTSYSVYVMMPMVATDLKAVLSKVGALSEDMAKKYMQQVVSAVEYLHGKGILHRDLKPANLLLTEGDKVLLADFGISTFMPPGQTFFTDLTCGSKAYMAPEQVTGEEEVDFSLKVDTWGLGVVAYELMHGRTPFSPTSSDNGASGGERKGSATGGGVQAQGIELHYDDLMDMKERENISSAKVTFDDQLLLSADATDFMSKLLERDVDMRLSASDAAEHPWVGGLEKAIELRAVAADAVAAREAEMRAEKVRLAGGRRRVVRRRAPVAEGVGTGGAVGAGGGAIAGGGVVEGGIEGKRLA